MFTLSVNDFILYMTLAQNPTQNLGAIIKSFTVNEYTDGANKLTSKQKEKVKIDEALQKIIKSKIIKKVK